MKKNIHPKYNILSAICSCGNIINTKSTLINDNFHIDICNMCHPFFTGTQRVINTHGRINRFNKRFNISEKHTFFHS